MAKKVALVVGGAGGIGAACVRRLADAYQPVVFDRVKRHGQRVKTYQLDVREAEAVERSVVHVQRTCGEVAVIIFAPSGPYRHTRLLNSAWPEYEEHMAVQVRGLLNVAHALKRRIEERARTKFVVILTEHCLGKPASGFAPYVVGKYALLGMARAMAAELASLNCTVNMVSPGLTRTPLISALPSKMVQLASEANPRGRLAEADDVAAAVVWLTSDEADYLNGVNIPVNGGNVMI